MHKNTFDELVDVMQADPNILPDWQPKRSETVDARKILDDLAGKSEAMTVALMKSVNEIFRLEDSAV